MNLNDTNVFCRYLLKCNDLQRYRYIFNALILKNTNRMFRCQIVASLSCVSGGRGAPLPHTRTDIRTHFEYFCGGIYFFTSGILEPEERQRRRINSVLTAAEWRTGSRCLFLRRSGPNWPSWSWSYLRVSRAEKSAEPLGLQPGLCCRRPGSTAASERQFDSVSGGCVGRTGTRPEVVQE